MWQSYPFFFSSFTPPRSSPSPLSSTPTHQDQYQHHHHHYHRHHHHPRPLPTHLYCQHLQVSGAFVTLRVFRVFRIFKFSRHSQVNVIIILFLYLIIIETSLKWKGLFSISFLSRVSEFSVTRCRYRDSHMYKKYEVLKQSSSPARPSSASLFSRSPWPSSSSPPSCSIVKRSPSSP